MEILGRFNQTAVKILNDLDSSSGGIGLIERKKQGLGKPNIIYVKDFMSVFRCECKNYTIRYFFKQRMLKFLKKPLKKLLKILRKNKKRKNRL